MSYKDGAALGKRPSATSTRKENQQLYSTGTTKPFNFQNSAYSGSLNSSFRRSSSKTQVDSKVKSVCFTMECSTDTNPTPPSGRIPSLSLQQLFLLNSCVCGLEFCASAAFTYIPPMLLKAGIEEEHMSLILGIGPLLGFFFVPMIGKQLNNYGDHENLKT